MTDTTISLRIEGSLKKQMEMYNEINWSAVLRKALAEQIEKMESIKREKAKEALEEIKNMRKSRFFDRGKESVEIIREWRDKRKF